MTVIPPEVLYPITEASTRHLTLPAHVADKVLTNRPEQILGQMKYTCGAQKVYVLLQDVKDSSKQKQHVVQEKTIVGVGTNKQLTDLQNLVEAALLA